MIDYTNLMHDGKLASFVNDFGGIFWVFPYANLYPLGSVNTILEVAQNEQNLRWN